MKIGLIQTRGIGDIIIALPIAKYFADRGDQVLWPIDEDFIPSFRPSAPYVEFIPLKKDHPRWMYEIPLEHLKSRGCEKIITLYSYLAHRQEVVNIKVAESCKFDEYKYAVAGVPFGEKWNLHLVRNPEREERLFQDVINGDEFIVCHLQGSNLRAELDVKALAEGRQIVEITNRTDNIFDWLSVIERASLRVMIESCFSNLTDQLRIPGSKILIHHAPMAFNPVMLGDWTFVGPPNRRN